MGLLPLIWLHLCDLCLHFLHFFCPNKFCLGDLFVCVTISKYFCAYCDDIQIYLHPCTCHPQYHGVACLLTACTVACFFLPDILCLDIKDDMYMDDGMFECNDSRHQNICR